MEQKIDDLESTNDKVVASDALVSNEQKPSNPIRTFLGISNRALIYKFLIILGFLPAVLGGYFRQNIFLEILFYTLSILCFVTGITYYIKERKNFLRDYRAVKVGKVPILDLYAHDYPMKDSLIMLALLLLGIVAIGFLANYFVK